jgi:hypothetical protein
LTATTTEADTPDLVSGGIVSAAQSIIQQLNNVGATWTGDGGIVINGAASQLSALVSQFQKAIGDKVTAPLNSFGYDIQALGKRIDTATNQLNQILTQQRNCGFEDASALLSGIKNAGLLATANIPLASTGEPRVDYFQFVGHNPEVVPHDGGEAVVYGYRLWVDDQPDAFLFDDTNNQLAKLATSRGSSDDSVQISLPTNLLAPQSGKVLTLEVLAHQAKKFLFIRVGTTTTNLNLPFAVPIDYVLQYKVSGQVNYKCSGEQNVNLATVAFDYHNSSCEDRHNVGPNTNTPQLPSGPNMSDAKIVGYQFVNWPDGHPSPNTRDQSSIQVSTTSTTVSASGWLDTASCTCVPIAGCKLNHDTFWQAAVVPEARYTQDNDITEPVQADTVPVSDPTTSTILSFSTSCSEQGVKNMQYTVVPLVNGVVQSPLYTSPFVSGDEKGVSDTQVLGPVQLSATWNPQAVAGRTQMQVSVTRSTCGY